jgi:hypothetical protein
MDPFELRDRVVGRYLVKSERRRQEFLEGLHRA